MFDQHTEWTQRPCHYVVASHYYNRAWLAGPYRTAGEAEAVLSKAESWAIKHGLDKNASQYRYAVYEHRNGQIHSILGELSP